ncbi:signal peptidase I [Natrinema sp. SYSU A 869]|uniref:signal peptidase I n=1 Tax=Natrinema sp. SYSU A 869 TaxID=2871694 RepID=UPI001CA42F02|nr:signal peptidase I [Natrinema sp. SYSU A 869]
MTSSRVRRWAELSLTVVVIAATLALIAGQLLGQPVFLVFVETGSMEPTLEPGDGFVAIPSQVTGDPEPGDVVVFESVEVNDGQLTTHRVVAETADGYRTQGDANPFADQDAGEPPVTDDRIAATALQVGGSVVVLPKFGTAVKTVRGGVGWVLAPILAALGLEAGAGIGSAGLVLFGVGLILFVVTLTVGTRRRAPGRPPRRRSTDADSIDPRIVALIVLTLVLVPANAAMIVPSGGYTMSVDADGSEDIEPGESITAEIPMRNGGLITTVVVLETATNDASIEPGSVPLAPGSESAASLRTTAPPSGEERSVAVSEYRYLRVLPTSLLLRFHAIDPLVAWGTINGLLGASVLGFVGGLLGFKQIRVRDQSRNVPLSVQLRRYLR